MRVLKTSCKQISPTQNVKVIKKVCIYLKPFECLIEAIQSKPSLRTCRMETASQICQTFKTICWNSNFHGHIHDIECSKVNVFKWVKISIGLVVLMYLGNPFLFWKILLILDFCTPNSSVKTFCLSIESICDSVKWCRPLDHQAMSWSPTTTNVFVPVGKELCFNCHVNLSDSR